MQPLWLHPREKPFFLKLRDLSAADYLGIKTPAGFVLVCKLAILWDKGGLWGRRFSGERIWGLRDIIIEV